MTNNSAAIVAEIEALRSDLLKVEAVANIMGKAAVTKTKELTATLQAANDRLTVALADEYETARKERSAQFSDMTIIAEKHDRHDGVLHMKFTISFSRLVYDLYAREAVPQPHKVIGFEALQGAAYEYLVNSCPEIIPAEIMAFAPHDPNEAFRLYFLSKRRGVIRTAADRP